jgi:pyruvate dehydrogenase E2 component (dihydrolipoamide acetyltransferase)
MSISIQMPKLADTMTEGTLVRWLKKTGDKIKSGDIIAEIETDKATMEMESFDDGILDQILVKDGEKVAVGQEIALLLEPGEKPGSAKPAATKASAPAAAAAPASAPAASAAPVAAPAADAGTGQRVKASPLARKIAAASGIDLSNIVGTGPGGRIVQADLAAQPASGLAKPAAAPAPAAATPAGAGDQKVALSGMRRVIADRLLQSKTTIPHFYLNIEVDAEPLMRLRAEINASAEAAGMGKVTVNDLVLKAVTAALVRVPKVNASWAGDSIIEYGSVHLSVAVAVEDGLVTPVLRDAGKLTLRQISDGVKDLAVRARNKKLKPEEYQGGTFTVSNLGSYGIESFSAIINPPQAAILSVGAIVKKPVVNAAGQIVAGQRLALGLSCDHRVVDGAIGAQYLGELRKLIENPTLMLL